MNTFQLNALNAIQTAMTNSYSEFKTPSGQTIHFDQAIERVSSNKAIVIHNRLSNETMVIESAKMEHLKRILTVFVVYGLFAVFAFWFVHTMLNRY